MKPDLTCESEDGEHDRLLRQRDQAVVCAILAAALVLAVAWSNFGREYPGLMETKAAVREHRQLLLEHQKLYGEVNTVLAANQRELEKIQRAGRPAP